MSLARIALRLAVVEALKGRTLVGAHVLDSQIGALEADGDGNVRTDQEQPFIAVYTDAATVSSDIELRSLGGNGTTELVIEAGITVAMTIRDPETKDLVVHQGIPAADDALEFHLDMVMRQVADVLSDPDNEWAEIARSLTYRYRKVERLRTSSDQGSVRLAGHQLRITLDLIDDPITGAALEAATPMARLLDRLDESGSSVLVAKAALMRAQVGGTDPDWKILQRRHGMTAGELRALGRGPVEGDTERKTPEFTTGAFDIEGTGSGEVTK
ncbi:hypothetical protein [Pararhizobium haloflavum]|uniref:hypothetical protein n=1 Tax=Pararhizobium haloflavum TaxID=2037914 RepID=UPI000C1A564A|nr:hypothetical protein [Pararhizobium haloflavum]